MALACALVGALAGAREARALEGEHCVTNHGDLAPCMSGGGQACCGGARVGDERVFLRRRVHVARRDANGGRGVVRELVLDRANDGRERFAVRARRRINNKGFVASPRCAAAARAGRHR